MLRVLIVEASPLIREGLSALLAGSEVQVMGSAGSAAEALDRLRELEPQVALLAADLAMADAHRLLTAICSGFPSLGIVVLDAHGRAAHLVEAMAHGASCYLGQGVTRESLLLAVQAAVQGYSLADRATLGELLEALTAAPVRGAGSAAHELTAREREVLDLVSQGLTNREIAARLTVSPTTAKTHLSSVLRKLGLADRLQAALWGRAHGFGRGGQGASPNCR